MIWKTCAGERPWPIISTIPGIIVSQDSRSPEQDIVPSNEVCFSFHVVICVYNTQC
jgi:hypothetical protein